MLDEFSRTRLLLGKPGMAKLRAASVAVFGLGGVGSYAAEALARCGVGAIALFDDDRICVTNINRQLLATHRTVGHKKAEEMKNRILEINPRCAVAVNAVFYCEENAGEFPLGQYDYVVDAIDTVSSKLVLIERAKRANVPIISCMGAGNKLDPTKFEVADIMKTSVCPLARVMRKELRARGISALKVVYSRERVTAPIADDETSCRYHCVCPPDSGRSCGVRRQIPGSISFVPPVAGFILAAEVVKDLAAS
ncbi:MAG: tRNA threonylcarbamoyladenosine dehydratase [Oscillospiraceae bacterium]|nr:tRNA threonylcarbamoyladenosine dehydratase [Oscillospiraceae bacterium]